MRELLPVGSVVKLKDSKSLHMVIGRFYEDTDSNELKTYLGCLYPIGKLDDSGYKFNHNDIEEVYFMGFKNNQEIELKREYKRQLLNKE